MRVAVGSTNPVKRGATEDALDAMAGTTVESVAVDSGVSDQPTGHAETIEGARTRARNAVTADGPASETAGTSPEPPGGGAYDLGVGIEAGVAEFDGTDGLSLVMWAAVTDGDRSGLAAGPSLRLPDRVADRVRAGEELGPVMDDAFDLEHVKEKEGAVGVLTGRIVDRRGALSDAVAGALGPFVTDAYE
jgi:non-canonical (house-cleaning) NTP pyrophosphatase